MSNIGVVTKTKSLQRRESLIGFIFASPAIAGTLVFFLIPFSIAIYISLTRSINVTGTTGIANYIDMLQNYTFQLAAWNTARFVFVAVPLIMIFSLFVALLLYRKMKGSKFFTSVFVFPLILPIVSVVLFFQIIFAGDGIVNQLLEAMGLPVTNWLHSDSAFTVLVILYIWKNCGYNIILFLAALNSIPKEYYEVFSLESKSALKRLYYVTVPLMSQYIFFIMCISVINTFKSFREAYILCGEYPHTSIYMVQHFMSNNIRNLNYPRLSVAAVLVFLVMIMFIIFFFRFRTQAGAKD